MSSRVDRAIYTGLLLPDSLTVTPAALVKVQREGAFEQSVLAYGRHYLALPGAMPLNPVSLPLRAEHYETPRRRLRDGGGLHLTLQDALPDAWGRLVLQAANQWREVDDIDALLQTNPDRVGAMVFHTEADMSQLALEVEAFILADLAEAAHRLAFDMEVPVQLRRLLRQGGSLGGARPKASLWKDRSLWLAKFPAADDVVDVQVLEGATLRLAASCGICVPDFELSSLGQVNALLLRRFDRPGHHPSGPRIHYLSAAAFTDSPYHSDAGSYVKLAQHLRLHGEDVAADLDQLFRRMVFNMLVDNSDDHVKNHGVLHVGHGRYRLAPAFDLVPQLTNLGYTGMAIAPGVSNANLALALDHADQFGLSRQEAGAIVHAVRQQVANWRPIFEQTGADAALIRRVEACFARQADVVTQ